LRKETEAKKAQAKDAQAKDAQAKDAQAKYVEVALQIVAEDGVDGLSLREVARRLGVSHQAPYRHFPSREHVVAELIRRSFVEFSDRLKSVAHSADPYNHLRDMGHAYLDFARDHALQYHLMFGTLMPQNDDHVDMRKESTAAFDLLLNAIAAIRSSQSESVDKPALERDAMFVWSALHGFVELQRKMVRRDGPVDLSGSDMRDALFQSVELGLRKTR
jgi:AcrR family transcriptional regulator